MSDIFSWWPVQEALTDPKYSGLWRDLVGVWLPIGRGIVVPDVSGQNNPMTITNASIPAAWVGGVDGWMLDLDGTDAELVASRIAGLSNWSVFMTFIPDDVTSISRTLFDQGDILIQQVNDGIKYGATNTLETDSTSTVSTCLTAGQPVNIFVTRSRTTMTCYVYDAAGKLYTDSFTVSGTAKTSLSSLILGSQSRTAFVYPASAMTNLTSEQLALINAADVLEIPRGSLSLDSDIDAEHWNGTQFSFEIIIRPNYVPGDNLIHYIFDNQGTGASQNRAQCYIDTVGLLTFVVHDTDSTQHLVSHDVTDWTAGVEHYVVCVLDLNNDVMILYVDGTPEDSTPTAALSSDTIGTIGTVTHIAKDNTDTNQVNGGIKYRIWNIPLTTAEITAQWNGGDMVEFSIVSPNVIAIDRFTESNTGIIAHHSGKLVSNIVAGGTQATLTTADGAEVFGDGVALIVQGADGFFKPGFADGDGSGNTLLVDDGAGAAVTDIEKVGKSLSFDDAIYLDIDTVIDEAPTLVGSYSLWVDMAWFGAVVDALIDMRTANNVIGLRVLNSGDLDMLYRGNNVTKQVTVDMTGVSDGLRHVAATWDTGGGGELKLFLDGYQIGATTTTLTAFVGVPTDARIGAYGAGLFPLTGSMSEAQIYNIALPDADVLWLATHPGATEAEIISNTTVAATETVLKHSYRNGNLLDETAYSNDGTAVDGTPSYTQQAFVSRKLNVDPSMENVGIGGVGNIDSTWTVTKDPTVKFMDSRSLKGVCAAGDDGDEFTIASPQLVNGQGYWQKFETKVTVKHVDTSLWMDIDGSATPITTRNITGPDDLHNVWIGGNLEFDGGTQYVNVPDDNTLDALLTFEAWVKPHEMTPTGSVRILLTKHIGPRFGIYFGSTNNDFYSEFQDSTGANSEAHSPSVQLLEGWYHIVGKFNAANRAEVFVNGVSAGLGSALIDALGNGTDMTGAPVRISGGVAARNTNCEIALVRAYSIAVSDADILWLSQNPGATKAELLAATAIGAGDIELFIAFAGDSVTDQSGNGNNGTKVNAPTYVNEWGRLDQCWKADQTDIEVNMRATGAGAGANTVEVNVDAGQLRVNLIENGGMESFSGGDPNIPTGWTNNGLDAGELVKAGSGEGDTECHSGDFCVKFTGSLIQERFKQAVVLVANKTYTLSFFAKGATGGETIRMQRTVFSQGTIDTDFTITSSWAMYRVTFTLESDATGDIHFSTDSGSTDDVYLDDVSLIINDTAPSTATRIRNFADGRVLPALIWKRKLTALETKELSRAKLNMFAYDDDINIPDQ